ncbi:MAG: hypothetical protein SO170_01545 [Butyribacter sp.]|nr:hypothetical protein [bacterium]MDY3853636.1 hypothetical protein [Butyribacter sp.]
MDRKEFFAILRQNLEGCIPKEEVESNIAFYRNYFAESEKSDKEIIQELGDPRLIAKTIIDAYKASKGPMADYYTEQAQREFRQENAGYEEGEGESSSKWYDKLLFVVLIAAVLILLAKILGFVVVYILPIVLLVVVIKILIDYFNR